MNAPRVTDDDYIQFLLAAQRVYSCSEAARCGPGPSHDAYTRLLSRLPPDTGALWREARTLVGPGGLLVIDDTTLDKPYARRMGLVTRHWSGKHHAVVEGISLTTLLWTDGSRSVPCDCRLYEPPAAGKGQVTKNDHFLAMLSSARERGLSPDYVCFDGWYAGLTNLKAVRGHGWRFLTRLKSNRQVDPDRSGNVAVRDLDIPEGGREVHLKGFGMVRVFRIAAPDGGAEQTDGGAEYWATDDLTMTEEARRGLARRVFAIENYHRALKQCCGAERAQVRRAASQKCHVILSVRAFLRLEAHRIRTGLSGYAAKLGIVREAIRQYLRLPTITLQPTA